MSLTADNRSPPAWSSPHPLVDAHHCPSWDSNLTLTSNCQSSRRGYPDTEMLLHPEAGVSPLSAVPLTLSFTFKHSNGVRVTECLPCLQWAKASLLYRRGCCHVPLAPRASRCQGLRLLFKIELPSCPTSWSSVPPVECWEITGGAK